jgi:hypothetical protein
MDINQDPRSGVNIPDPQHWLLNPGPFLKLHSFHKVHLLLGVVEESYKKIPQSKKISLIFLDLDPDPNSFRCWVSPAEKESGSVLDISSKMGRTTTYLKSLFRTLGDISWVGRAGDENVDFMVDFLSSIVHTNIVSDSD